MALIGLSVFVIGHHGRLGDEEMSYNVLVEILDGIVGGVTMSLEWLKAVGHATRLNYISRLDMSLDGTSHLGYILHYYVSPFMYAMMVSAFSSVRRMFSSLGSLTS